MPLSDDYKQGQRNANSILSAMVGNMAAEYALLGFPAIYRVTHDAIIPIDPADFYVDPGSESLSE